MSEQQDQSEQEKAAAEAARVAELAARRERLMGDLVGLAETSPDQLKDKLANVKRQVEELKRMMQR